MTEYNDGEWPLCDSHIRVRRHITALCRFLEAARVPLKVSKFQQVSLGLAASISLAISNSSVVLVSWKSIAMSAIWAHFKINDNDRSKAQCKICTATVSSGRKESTSFNTSNLIKHLKSTQSSLMLVARPKSN